MINYDIKKNLKLRVVPRLSFQPTRADWRMLQYLWRTSHRSTREVHVHTQEQQAAKTN